jgi:hypothetical protein
LDGLAAIFGFAHHFNIALVFQQRPKTLPDHPMVFRQQDSNPFHRRPKFSCSGGLHKAFEA